MSSEKIAKLEGINKVLRFHSIFWAVGFFLWMLFMGVRTGGNVFLFWLGYVIMGLPKIWAGFRGGLGAAITGPLKADYEVVTVDGTGREISNDGGAQSIQMAFILRLIMAGALLMIGPIIACIHVIILSIRYIFTALTSRVKSSVKPNGYIIILINLLAPILGGFIGSQIGNVQNAVAEANRRSELGVIISGDFDYHKNSEGNGIVIYRFNGKGGKVTIPDTFDNLPVITIGMGAFSGSKGLTEVTLPGNLRYIQRDAFARTGLTSIVIPEGVTNIGGYAFDGCENLTSVTLPRSVLRIGGNAFGNNTSLTDVIIPSGHKITYGFYFSAPGNRNNVVTIEGMGMYKHFNESKDVSSRDKSNSFNGCINLSAASRQAIKDSGYDGDF